MVRDSEDDRGLGREKTMNQTTSLELKSWPSKLTGETRKSASGGQKGKSQTQGIDGEQEQIDWPIHGTSLTKKNMSLIRSLLTCSDLDTKSHQKDRKTHCSCLIRGRKVSSTSTMATKMKTSPRRMMTPEKARPCSLTKVRQFNPSFGRPWES